MTTSPMPTPPGVRFTPPSPLRLLLLCLSFAAAAAAAFDWTVCYVPEGYDPATMAHVAAAFDAERRAAPALPNAALRVLHPNVTADNGVVDRITALTQDCDAVLGPESSDFLESMRGVTGGKPLIGPGTVSVAKDRAAFGLARVAHPADQTARIAIRTFFVEYKLRRVSIVADDTDAGAVILAAAIAEAESLQIRVTQSSMVRTESEARAFVRSIDTPGVLVLLDAPSAVFNALKDEATTLSANSTHSGSSNASSMAAMAHSSHTTHAQSHVFIFVGAWCRKSQQSPAPVFAGAMCIDEALNDARMAALEAEFAARNVTFVHAALAGAGVTSTTDLAAAATPPELTTKQALRRDAVSLVLAALRAVEAQAAANASVTYSRAQRRQLAAAAVQRVVVVGTSGVLQFDDRGRRLGGRLDLVNVLAVTPAPPNNFTIFAHVNVSTGALVFEEPRRALNWLQGAALAVTPPDNAFLATTFVQLCYIYIRATYSTEALAQGLFAVQHYADRYPIRFDFEPLLVESGEYDLNSVASEIVRAAPRCDVFVGPPSSLYSTGLASLIEKPWITEGASSTALSDAETYPWFSRVVPSDAYAGGALAAMLLRFRFLKIALITSDEPYGRSVAEGVSRPFTAAGGAVAFRQALTLTQLADNATLDEAVDSAISTSQVVVIAAVNTQLLARRLDDREIYKRAVLFFDNAVVGFERLESAFTVITKQNATAVDSYMQQHFGPWATSQDRLAPFGSRILHMDAAALLQPSEWALLGHDAFYYIMEAIGAHARQSRLDLSAAALQAVLRNASVVPDGLTGPVGLKDNGDRDGAGHDVANVIAGRLIRFGSWNDADGLVVNNGTVLSWLGGSVRSLDAPEVNVQQDSDSLWNVPPLLIIIALCAGLFVALVAFALFKVRKMSPEAFGRAISSGLVFYLAKVTFHIVDLGADVLACYVVMSDDGISTEIKALFAALTGVACVASFWELGLLFIAIAKTLRGKVLTIDQDAAQQQRLELAEVLTLCFEDLPIAIITAFIVLSSDGAPEWVLTGTLVLSAFGAGSKVSTLGPLMRKWWVRRDYEQQLGDELTGAPLEAGRKQQLLDVLEMFEAVVPRDDDDDSPERVNIPRQNKAPAEEDHDAMLDSSELMSVVPAMLDEEGTEVEGATGRSAGVEVDGSRPAPAHSDKNDADDDSGIDMPSDAELHARCEAAMRQLNKRPIDVESPQCAIDFFAVFLELLLPQRYQLIHRAAETTAKQLVADNVSQNEFYAVLLPYLTVLFDRADESSNDAIVHFSSVETFGERQEQRAALSRHYASALEALMDDSQSRGGVSSAVPSPVLTSGGHHQPPLAAAAATSDTTNPLDPLVQEQTNPQHTDTSLALVPTPDVRSVRSYADSAQPSLVSGAGNLNFIPPSAVAPTSDQPSPPRLRKTVRAALLREQQDLAAAVPLAQRQSSHSLQPGARPGTSGAMEASMRSAQRLTTRMQSMMKRWGRQRQQQKGPT